MRLLRVFRRVPGASVSSTSGIIFPPNSRRLAKSASELTIKGAENIL